MWFDYNGGLADNVGGGTAYTQDDPMAPGTQSSWSFYETDLTAPVVDLYVKTITYVDESEGTYCAPYPLGASTNG